MKSLPKFRSVPYERVHEFISRALTNERQAPTTRLVDLLVYEDKHYRAIFRPDYFALADDQQAPTKSQWNTLKKHLKRIDDDLFIFKEHGEVPCGPTGGRCYYIDFGFFAHHDREEKPPTAARPVGQRGNQKKRGNPGKQRRGREN